MASEISKIAIFGYPSCIKPSNGGVRLGRKIFRGCQRMAKVPSSRSLTMGREERRVEGQRCSNVV